MNIISTVSGLTWYQKNIAHYKGLLAFRKAHPTLRLQTRDEVLASVKPVHTENTLTAAYLIDDKIYVVFNVSAEEVKLALPKETWNLNICEMNAGTNVLSQVSNVLNVAPVSAAVLTRN